MIVRGSLFNKQVTVRSLFFLSEIFWNTNFKKFLLKMQALESEFSFKINFNPFWQAKRARSKAWGVRSGHHLYSAQVATYPWGQRIFSFFSWLCLQCCWRFFFVGMFSLHLMGTHKLSRQIFVSTARPRDIRPLRSADIGIQTFLRYVDFTRIFCRFYTDFWDLWI